MRKRIWKWCNLLGVLALMGLTASCGSPAQFSDPASEGDTTENQQNTPDPLVSCAASPSGSLVTSIGNIAYDGGTVTSSGKYLGAEGCMTELTLGFTRGDGCTLDLTLREKDGSWSLAEGSFSLDASCGLTGNYTLGMYTLDASTAMGGLSEAPSLAADTAASCLDASKLGLMGQGEFVLDTERITLTLNELALSGETGSELADTGACPELAVACEDTECGSDQYGNECGACDLGYTCNAGTCAAEGCPPVGPYGTEPYETLTDLEIFDCDGNPVHIHELCGAPAGFFNLLAGW